jgi:hypothetical protein
MVDARSASKFIVVDDSMGRARRIVNRLMAGETSVTDSVKAIGLAAGARVVGVAAAEAFRAGVPEGYRPEDILPGARSVVVAGGDGPTAGAWRSPDHRVMEITGYDLRENVAIHAMCDYIERSTRCATTSSVSTAALRSRRRRCRCTATSRR